jgi:Mg/Co/Ni transporter MgtE
MTSVLVTATADQSVAQVVARLREQSEHAVDLEAICVVDGQGRLLDDVAVVELLLADANTPRDAAPA